MKWIRITFISIIIFGFLSHCLAVNLEDIYGISIGNAYLGLRYGFSPKFGVEIRKGLDSEVNTTNIRGYFNIYDKEKSGIYLGAEYSSINFNSNGIAGEGYSVLPFAGIEFFLGRNISLGIDLGPMYINLGSQNVSVDGFEYVSNFGLNYYFNSKKQSNESEKETVEQPVKEVKKFYIKVNVLNKDRIPLSEAVIKLSQGENEIEKITTDETGAYTFEDLESSTYTIKAWKQGYATQYKTIYLHKPVRGNIILEKVSE